MNIIDLKGKPLAYSRNLGDAYYWEYHFIIDVDDEHYCLLNYEDSMSGYVEYQVESIDEEFLSDYLTISLLKTDLNCVNLPIYQDMFDGLHKEEAILIKKSKVDKLLKVYK